MSDSAGWDSILGAAGRDNGGDGDGFGGDGDSVDSDSVYEDAVDNAVDNAVDDALHPLLAPPARADIGGDSPSPPPHTQRGRLRSWSQLRPPSPLQHPGRGAATARAARAHAWKMAACVVGAVCVGVVMNVSRKAMYDAYGTRYVFFRQQLTNLMYNVWATTLLVLTTRCGRAATPKGAAGGGGGGAGGSTGPLAALPFPWWKLLPAAALDAMADFLMSVAGPNTPGAFQILLGQSAVFFTMVYVAPPPVLRFAPRAAEAKAHGAWRTTRRPQATSAAGGCGRWRRTVGGGGVAAVVLWRLWRAGCGERRPSPASPSARGPPNQRRAALRPAG